MLLFWHIRYVDRASREFRNRDLWLITNDLDPVTRAAVEVAQELADRTNDRGMLKYRHLFCERADTPAELHELCERYGHFASFSLHDYFEDENCVPLSNKELAVILTGSQSAVMLPPGAQQHDIDHILAHKSPIDVGSISLDAEQQ